MLLQFTLKNHLSFLQESTISMETGERLRKFRKENTMMIEDQELLKNILIVGANGAGKSNILHGLARMKQLVLKEPTLITKKIPFSPFLLGETEEVGTLMEVEFIFKGKFLKFRFVYNEEEFLEEALYIKSNVKEEYQAYYERIETNIYDSSSRFQDLLDKTPKNTLFLYQLQRQNDMYASLVLEWFSKTLYFFDSETVIDNYVELLENEKNKKIFLEFLKAADFNIVDIMIQKEVEKVPSEVREALNILISDFDIPSERVTKKLRTVYKMYSKDGDVIGTTSLPIGMESKGTQKIIDLALSVIYCKENKRIMVMDEFDESIHLGLAKALLQLFNSEENENQFILTTHKIQLLDNNLRTDQIYFVEKIFNGESEIFSLFDFNDLEKKSRFDVKRFKQYLDGKFGAIPLIDLNRLRNIYLS